MTLSKQYSPPEKDRWADIKKKGILEAVFRVLAQNDFKNITMDKVAKEAGVAKGTLYLHFKSKEELFDSAWEAGLQPLAERIDEILTADLSPVKKFHYIVSRILQYFDENKELFSILLYDRMNVQGHVIRYEDSRYRRFLNKISELVRGGISLGLFKPLNVEKIAAVFVDACAAMVTQRLLIGSVLPPEEDAELLCEIMLHGIAVKVGAE